MKKILTVVIIGLLCFSMFGVFAPRKASASSDLLSLPAEFYGWQYADTSHNSLMSNPLAGYLVSASQQSISASPGQTVSISVTYQVFDQSPPNNPGEIDQLFFVESWTTSWPPQGYTIPLYNGGPGLNPGVTQTNTISFAVPSVSGTYYLWLCFEAQYSMQDAVNQRTRSMAGLPGHIKVVVAPPAALVGYWKFDEGSGNIAYDSSGNGNDGVLLGGAKWVDGIAGKAVSCDGINDYVQITENTELNPHTSDWTESAWVNIARLDTDTSVPQFIIMTKRQTASDSSLTLMVSDRASDSSARFAFVWDAPSEIAGAAGPLMNVLGWHHIAGVRRGGELYVYVDGAEYGPNNCIGVGSNYLTSTTDVTSASPLNLCHHGAWNKYSAGIIDEVKIYNYARTAEEILSDYNSLVPNSPPSIPTIPNVVQGVQIVQTGYPLDFTSSATDPDGDTFSITFDWGDGTPQDTIGPSTSPTRLATHSWSHTGMYQVKAKATDIHGAESSWSSPLEVTTVSYEDDHEWGGYMAASLFPTVTISVEGKWVYPNYGTIPLLSSQSSWVGIGGNGKTKPLLQAGILVMNPLGVPITVPFYMTVNSDGSWTKVCGWEYALSPPSPGDTIWAAITQIGYNKWQIYVQDITKGWTPWMPVVTFQPDTTSVEWIHEPLQGPLGAASFDSVTFQEARLTANGNSYKVGNIDPSQLQSELVLCNVKWDAAMVTKTSSISNYEKFSISDTGQRPTAVPKSTAISLHSSARLSVWDSEGNHDGYNSTTGFVDMQIPNSYYFEDQYGAQYFILYQSDAYRIDVIGTSSGDFHLHLQVFSSQTLVLDEWINGTTSIGATETHHLYVPPQGTPVVDDTPPSTQLTIREPKYVTSTQTYVTKDSSFTLRADDGTGSGVASICYRIWNDNYNSGWLTCSNPFYITTLANGNYTVSYYSVDNVGNKEAEHTVKIVLFSWTYDFTDSYGRGTMLEICTQYKLFDFIAPNKDFGIKQDSKMIVLKNAIVICYNDSAMRLTAAAIIGKVNSCAAVAWDKLTNKTYMLIGHT